MIPLKKRPLLIGLVIAAAVLGVMAVVVRKGGGHTAHEQIVYYCPMHPTYTSNKPGDCPICNMRLVKRESEPANSLTRQPANPLTRKPANPEDICYMHNCPMVKKGQKCPMLVVAKAGEKVTCPICGTHIAETARTTAPTKKILYWTDPMLPGFKADKPGKSPMGMDLVPVYEENVVGGESTAAPLGYAPILVTSQKQQFIGVKSALAQKRSMTKTIRTVGKIAYDPELYQAEQEYLQALKAFERAKVGTIPEVTEQAQSLVESSRMRLRLSGLGQDMIEEMANWDGPDKSLLLADPQGHVWLYATVYEFELPLVKIGQAITIDSLSMPNKTLEGTIRSIDSVLDPVTRSARVRAVLTDTDSVLKPEMFVNASIVVRLGDVLAIPEEAVFNTGTKQIVFVDKGQGLFEPRDVTAGVKADGYYEVKEGVAEGEAVVTSGNFLIDSESRLKAALEGMSGSGGHQHGQ